MRSLFIPLQLATNARQLEFVTDLDPSIDREARKAGYEAMGESQASIAEHLQVHPDVEGIVLGDETRLRQIITNLARYVQNFLLCDSKSTSLHASNACKFTPAGGKLLISTRLISPSSSEICESTNNGSVTRKELLKAPVGNLHSLSTTHLSEHNIRHSKPRPPLDWVVVRIEVTDTGSGIKPKDMAKLFCEQIPLANRWRVLTGKPSAV